MTMQDLALAQRVASGDETAFGELYNKLSPGIYRHVFGIVKNRLDAEDLTQEVFLRAFSSIKTYSGHATLERWLRKVATNICIDSMRKKRIPTIAWPSMVSKNGDEQPVDFPDLANQLPLDQLEAEDGKQAVLNAMESLPGYYKDSIMLYSVFECTGEEVAKKMSCPIGTVKSRLSRARTILRSLLSNEADSRDLRSKQTCA